MGQIKTIKGKVAHKHETEADWLLSSYVPEAGEIVVYDADDNYDYPRIKVGDGETIVSELGFVGPDKIKELNLYGIDLQLNASDGKTLSLESDGLGWVEYPSQGYLKLQSGQNTVTVGAEGAGDEPGTGIVFKTYERALEIGGTGDIHTYAPTIVHAPVSAADRTSITIDSTGIHTEAGNTKSLGTEEAPWDSVYATEFYADKGAFHGYLNGTATNATKLGNIAAQNYVRLGENNVGSLYVDGDGVIDLRGENGSQLYLALEKAQLTVGSGGGYIDADFYGIQVGTSNGLSTNVISINSEGVDVDAPKVFIDGVDIIPLVGENGQIIAVPDDAGDCDVLILGNDDNKPGSIEMYAAQSLDFSSDGSVSIRASGHNSLQLSSEEDLVLQAPFLSLMSGYDQKTWITINMSSVDGSYLAIKSENEFTLNANDYITMKTEDEFKVEGKTGVRFVTGDTFTFTGPTANGTTHSVFLTIEKLAKIIKFIDSIEEDAL